MLHFLNHLHIAGRESRTLLTKIPNQINQLEGTELQSFATLGVDDVATADVEVVAADLLHQVDTRGLDGILLYQFLTESVLLHHVSVGLDLLQFADKDIRQRDRP